MTQKNISAGKELHQNLRDQVALLEVKVKKVEAQQLAGDFSAETARLLNIISNKLVVTRNRLNGKMTSEVDGYKSDIMIEVPKYTRK